MNKEIYLYSQIYDFIAQDLIAQLEEYRDSDITIRTCSPGGSVFAGWGIIAKMTEHTGLMKIKCDGLVASMALYMLLFCDDVESLDVTKFVLHRADMYVGDPEDQEFLNSINSQLQTKLTAKIDVNKLKEITGFSIKDIFNPDGERLDVNLSAKQAKEIGLIKKVNKLTPAVAAEMKAISENFKYNVAANIQEPTIKTPTKMTIEKLKLEHPEVYASIFALGVAQEKDRVEACLVFNEIDPVAVKAAIESGKPLTQKAMADFSLKAMSGKHVEAVTEDSTKTVVTTEVDAKTVVDVKLDAFKAELEQNKK